MKVELKEQCIPNPKFKVLEICCAYEQGYGKGLDDRNCLNPYKPNSNGWDAWGYGYYEGQNKLKKYK